MSADEETDGPDRPPPRARRGRRRASRRRTPTRDRTGQTWVQLVMAGFLLTGLLLFWSRLATGAAACFSNLAPPPEATTAPPPQAPDPRHRQIHIKRADPAP